MFQDFPRAGPAAAQPAGQHPAAEEIVARRRQARAAAADEPHAGRDAVRGDMREGLPKQGVAILLEARNLSGGEKQRNEAVRRRLARQGHFQDAPQLRAVGARHGRIEARSLHAVVVRADPATLRGGGANFASHGARPWGGARTAANRERFARDENIGIGHDEIQRARADGFVHDEQRAVAGAEQQDAAREPRLHLVDAGPDAVAAGQDPHGLRPR